jgi:HlyD family secretion protein
LGTDKTIIQNDNGGLNSNTIVLKNTFPVNGNEIDEIISKKPPFFVRWGTVFFLFLLITIAAISWFIQYPDIVIANARLTSINAPKEVLSKTSGALIKLFVKEGETVKTGTVIGYMESTANPDEVIKLSDTIDSMAVLLITNTSRLIPHFNTTYINLGELQQDYQAFTKAAIDFRNYIAGGFYLKKRKMLSKDLQLLQKLQANLLQQKNLNAEDLQLTQTTFSANESLKGEKVISDLDYSIEKSKLINKKLTLPQLNVALINNETQQHEKHKEIIELENTIAEQKNIFRQSLNTFKSRLNEWKKKILLNCPG